MVAIKSGQVQSFLKSIDKAVVAVLVHGNDPGLVSETARTAVERLAARETPPGEVLRIDEADVEQDPERLAVELQTVAMFGGRRVVHTAVSRRVGARMLEPLLSGAPLAGVLVVEAGSLKAADAVRTLFEKSPTAAAIACYADEARDIEVLIRDALGAAGMEIDPEARQLLVARLGADRILSRGEIEKLVLYAQGKRRIEVDDVLAVVGDASELAIDKVLQAAVAGDGGKAVIECDRAVASGESPQAIVIAAQWYFHRLDRMRAGVEAGQSMDEAARALRPPLNFKSRPLLEAQCRSWTSERLALVRRRITEATKQARLNSDLETAHVERLLLEIARLARAGQQRGPGS